MKEDPPRDLIASVGIAAGTPGGIRMIVVQVQLLGSGRDGSAPGAFLVVTEGVPGWRARATAALGLDLSLTRVVACFEAPAGAIIPMSQIVDLWADPYPAPVLGKATDPEREIEALAWRETWVAADPRGARRRDRRHARIARRRGYGGAA